MKKIIVITVDLSKEDVFEQIAKIEAKYFKEPWYKRVLRWFCS